MSRIGDEVLLRVKRGLQAIEHRVERAAELGELVVALDLDAPREAVSLIERAVSVLAQRREDAAGHDECDQRGQQQHRERDARGDLRRLVDLLGLEAQVVRDHEGAALTTCDHDRHRQVAHVSLVEAKRATPARRDPREPGNPAAARAPREPPFARLLLALPVARARRRRLRRDLDGRHRSGL